MMDPESARQSLLDDLFHMGGGGGADLPTPDALARRRDHLLGLLEALAVHGFDLTQALVEEIRRMEEGSDVG